jgi:IS5 family transposase
VLRVYFLLQWYGLADEALEDTIYGSQAMHDFAGIDLGGRGSVPYATIIASPSSTKNRSGERDPEKYG